MWFTEWSHVKTNKQTKKKTKNKNKNLRIYALREHHFIDYRISYGTGLGRGCKSTWYWLVNTTVMYLNRLLYLWNHWWALQFNWLSAVWFIRESPDFLLQITSVLNNVIHVLSRGRGTTSHTFSSMKSKRCSDNLHQQGSCQRICVLIMRISSSTIDQRFWEGSALDPIGRGLFLPSWNLLKVELFAALYHTEMIFQAGNVHESASLFIFKKKKFIWKTIGFDSTT